MSLKFREKFGVETEVSRAEMRAWSLRPGRKDEHGAIQYTTQQQHKDECDINNIIRKYDKTGLIKHVARFEAKFGDFTGLDFRQMQQTVIDAKNQFAQLPMEIRKRFDNNPEKLIEFMEHPENRDEAIKLGLIDANWTPETDGLGEHVKSEDEREFINEPAK